MAQSLCHSLMSDHVPRWCDVDNCVICRKDSGENNHKGSALRDTDIMFLRPINDNRFATRNIMRDLQRYTYAHAHSCQVDNNGMYLYKIMMYE